MIFNMQVGPQVQFLNLDKAYRKTATSGTGKSAAQQTITFNEDGLYIVCSSYFSQSYSSGNYGASSISSSQRIESSVQSYTQLATGGWIVEAKSGDTFKVGASSYSSTVRKAVSTAVFGKWETEPSIG